MGSGSSPAARGACSTLKETSSSGARAVLAARGRARGADGGASRDRRACLAWRSISSNSGKILSTTAWSWRSCKTAVIGCGPRSTPQRGQLFLFWRRCANMHT